MNNSDRLEEMFCKLDNILCKARDDIKSAHLILWKEKELLKPDDWVKLGIILVDTAHYLYISKHDIENIRTRIVSSSEDASTPNP